MFPPIDTIQGMVNYSSLIHLKARLDNRMHELTQQYRKANDVHMRWVRTPEGRQHYAAQRGRPDNKRTAAPTLLERNRLGSEVEDLREILVVVMARLNEVSPPPIEVPKKQKLYDEPWHG